MITHDASAADHSNTRWTPTRGPRLTGGQKSRADEHCVEPAYEVVPFAHFWHGVAGFLSVSAQPGMQLVQLLERGAENCPALHGKHPVTIDWSGSCQPAGQPFLVNACLHASTPLEEQALTSLLLSSRHSPLTLS